MHAANSLDALEQVVAGLRIGIVQQALVAGALGAGLVGVDARDDEQAVSHLLLKLCETVHVFQNGVLAIGRAGADDQGAAGVLAAENRRHLGVELALGLDQVGSKRHLLADIFRNGKQALEMHGHGDSLAASRVARGRQRLAHRRKIAAS